jgi:hypothetical protein
MCLTEFIYKLICTLRKESILKSYGNRKEDPTTLLYLCFKVSGNPLQGYEYIFSASHVSTQYCKAVRNIPAGVSYVTLSGWQCL